MCVWLLFVCIVLKLQRFYWSQVLYVRRVKLEIEIVFFNHLVKNRWAVVMKMRFSPVLLSTLCEI